MSRIDRLALAFSLLAMALAYAVTAQVFEGMAHLEDEMAYVWQAQVIARGQLTTPSPPEPRSLIVPFVVDYHGLRFGKYPLGWPVVLALGVWMGARSLVNPLLGGLGVWLTYCLGRRFFSPQIGLLAAGLTLVSPFFLLNSGSLLSHPLGLVLSLAFVLAWWDAFGDAPGRGRLAVIVAALTLGGLALTRPMTAVAVALPFSLHGAYLFVCSGWAVRRRLLGFGLLVVAVGSLYFAWQWAVTGDPWLNPYTLWWAYDRIGFGPGVGVTEAGHSLRQAVINLRHSLQFGGGDIFGWGPVLTWIFLPFGLLAAWRGPRRNWLPLALVGSVFISLLLVYLLYWIGSWLYGPRYYYEGFFSLTLFSAAGLAYLAGWGQAGTNRLRRLRPALTGLALALLVAYNLFFHLPPRFQEMHALNDVSRARLQPFITAQAQGLSPALVFVHPQQRWMELGAFMEMQSPFFDTPFIFAFARSERADGVIAGLFPGRKIFHYYPDDPFVLYTAPRP